MNRCLITCGILAYVSITASYAAAAVSGGFINGSFETGNFSGWITQDVPDPNDTIAVLPLGSPLNASSFFTGYTTNATDGLHSAVHSFSHSNSSDDSPLSIRIAQDIFVNNPTLQFDHRHSWFSAFTLLEKDLSVSIEPVGGGIALAVYPILIAPPTTFQVGEQYQSESVDLTPFINQSVRVSFDWTIRDPFPHPAIAELDNVRLAPIPEPTSAALLLITLGAMAARYRPFPS